MAVYGNFATRVKNTSFESKVDQSFERDCITLLNAGRWRQIPTHYEAANLQSTLNSTNFASKALRDVLLVLHILDLWKSHANSDP